MDNTNLNPKSKKELQASFEIQARHNLYISPEFPFLHCLGVWNFISAFTYTINGQEDKGLISKTDGLDHAIAKYVEKLKALR